MKEAPLLGFTLAIVSAIPFAAYIFSRKLSRLPVLEYQCWLGLAVAPVGVVFAFVFGKGLNPEHPAVWAALICGPIWTLGSICLFARRRSHRSRAKHAGKEPRADVLDHLQHHDLS